MNEENTKGFRLGVILALVLIVAVYFIFSKDRETGESNVPITGDTNGLEVTVVPIEKEKTLSVTPDLTRLVIGNNDLSDVSEQKIISDIKSISQKLKNTPTINDWNQLGSLRKILGDYEGARLVWEYVTVIDPNNYVIYWNLADLYHFYIKDYPKAETYYKKVIAKNPAYIGAYQNLAELYEFFYKEKSNQIPVVLLDGLAKNPNAYDLMVLLARYYKGVGDKTNATTYYNKASNLAGGLGQTEQKEAIEEELKGL